MGQSRAAASGGNAADGSGSEDGEAGDPNFDLLPGDQKRKILKQRKMAADKAPTAKKARRGDAGEAGDVEDDDVVVIIGRAQAAAEAESMRRSLPMPEQLRRMVLIRSIADE